MEIRSLRYFQTVALCGSYSRGSELLHISQPAVSRAIRQLEEELDASLFTRHSHGVSLTGPGQVLLERTQTLLRQMEQTKAEIRSGQTSPSGVITFAIAPIAGSVLVPPLVERFNAQYPNVFLNVIGGFSGYIHEWLVRGQVDLACVHDPQPQKGFRITPLINEQVYLVGKRGALPFERESVSTDDLAQLPLILSSRANASRRLLDRWVGKAGVSLNIRHEVDDHSITRALVNRGVGFTLLTQGALDSGTHGDQLQAWPFHPRAYWPLALVSCSTTPSSQILDAFEAALCAVTRELAESGVWSGELLMQE